uniref:Uncharacterized protein n=1 Tax=Globisporangium ultimum (strain ATCC 200006 / CBS 805.95 / DAOM BR144) TaxID=431595 RepID=K3WQR1_GLOUD
MIWAAVKMNVAKENTTFSLIEVEQLTRKHIRNIDSAEWTKCVQHCIKVEDEYYDASDDIPFDG